MKTRIFVLVSLLLAATSYAQNDEYYKTFNGNKVYIVFIGKKDFDSALRKACSQYWTASPIAGFITKDKLKDLITDKSNSFIQAREWGYEMRSSMNSYRATGGLYLTNGGKRVGTYNLFHHVVARVDLDFYGYEYNIENAKYRLPILVANLSETVRRDKFKEQSPKILKNKILLINRNHTEKQGKIRPNVLKEALAAYKYKYEIVDEEKIESAINARDSSYALLVPVLHDQASHVEVYDLGTYQAVYAHGRRKTVFRFPWVREEVFEEFNNAFR
jgi:hypothetical protein